MEGISGFAIARLAANHIGAAAELERMCFSGRPWTDEAIGLSINKPGAHAFAAIDKAGDLAGYVIASAAAGEGELHRLCVHPSHRRRGMGEALVRAAIEAMAESGAREIFIELREKNRPALRLYGKMGFEVVGHRSGYYSAPVEDAVVMKKTVYNKATM